MQSTDTSNGEIRVCWSKPIAGDLDTLLNPGPYRYEVLRATGATENASQFTPIGVNFISPTFAAANDTCFTDTGLNTQNTAYSYRIRFYAGASSSALGISEPASSVFLQIAPTDRANRLSWSELVPWDNYRYTVFRRNLSGTLEEITGVFDSPFTDSGLENGQSYCYVVRSEGTYGVSGLASPLLNRSQEFCATPLDNVAPCVPELQVENPCGSNFNCTEETLLFNTLVWSSPATLCPQSSQDVAGYKIFYAPSEEGEFELIETIAEGGVLRFEHKPERGLAGCYAISAVDTAGNESARSTPVCVDNCPFYELPNTFTPNGDGFNDIFRPRAVCFIEQVEFSVYNRWGQLVFKTTDPNLEWQGLNMAGQNLASGTYYYTCRVFEQRVGGVVPLPDLLSGWIELVR